MNKICTLCNIEKPETEFYNIYKSITRRTESQCKKCRSEKSKIRSKYKVKIKYEPKYSGNQECKKCNIIKIITEFGINKSEKLGRKRICKPCEYTLLNSNRRKNKKIFKPTSISKYAQKISDYKNNLCEVCGLQYFMIRSNHKRCENCTKLVRSIHRHLKPTRNKKIIISDDKLNRIELSVEIAKLFNNSNNCVYCKRSFTFQNPKHVEHIIPISLGGTNFLSNFVISCMECNFSKNNSTLKDWINLTKLVTYKNNLKNNILEIKSNIICNNRSCIVCSVNINSYHGLNKNCNNCKKIIKKINSTLTSGRNGKSMKCKRFVVYEIAKKWINSNNCCYCDIEFCNKNNKSIDHIIPVSLGGKNEINNLTISCLKCNKSKARLEVSRWKELCELITNNADNILKLTI